MRKTAVRIAVIGAGSAEFSAEIVRDLCVCPGLSGSHVVLMDIDAKRLAMIGSLAEKIARELSANITFSCTADRREALKNADFVINSVLIKAGKLEGHEWVELQRSIAEKHGYYRGAKLHLIAQMHFMLELAHDIKGICPTAWLLQVGNPVFEGCTLMHRAVGIKLIGLCHGHYGIREIGEKLGLESKDVSGRAIGFNHWIWMTDFRYKGQDAYPLLDEWIAKESEKHWATFEAKYSDMQLSRGAVHQYKTFGLMPIGDTARHAGWWLHTDLQTKQKWFGQIGGFDSEIGWAQYLDNVALSIKQVEDAASDTNIRATDVFGKTQGDEQIIPIINALSNDTEGIYQVNIPNQGCLIEGFPENLVVETQAVVNGSGVHGIKMPPLPTSVFAGAMIPRWREAEQAAECMRLRSYNLLLQFILNDPRTQSLKQAEGLLAEWLENPNNTRLQNYFS